MMSSYHTIFISLLFFCTLHALFAVSSSSSLGENNLILVKIGGSCVTNKSVFEELNNENLEKFCKQLKLATMNTASQHVVVHGAGSFGHFSARQYELVNGGRDQDWRQGFCETRSSVLKLNSLIVDALTKHKHPATTVTLFPSALTSNRVLRNDGPLSMCDSILENRMTPVIHGDAVLDVSHRCTIFR